MLILSNVLEHIADRVGLLKKLSRLSHRLLIRVPMIERDWIVLYKKSLGLEYRLDSTHYIEYTMKVLRDEASRSGWNIVNSTIQFGECWAVLEH